MKTTAPILTSHRTRDLPVFWFIGMPMVIASKLKDLWFRVQPCLPSFPAFWFSLPLSWVTPSGLRQHQEGYRDEPEKGEFGFILAREGWGD